MGLEAPHSGRAWIDRKVEDSGPRTEVRFLSPGSSAYQVLRTAHSERQGFAGGACRWPGPGISLVEFKT